MDGKYLAVDAFMKENSVYAPVRVIAEAIGAEVRWDGSNRTVLISTRSDGA